MIYLQILFTFVKIGLFTFGGGYAMIPLIQSEMSANGWINPHDLINFMAVSQSLPGAFAVNISTYIGNIMGGFPGAGIGAIAVSLPSFIIIILIGKFYDKFKKSKIVDGAMSGLRPAAIGLIGAAFISILKLFITSSKPDYLLLIALGIFAVLMFLQIKKVHPVFIIIISAVLGILTGVIFQFPA